VALPRAGGPGEGARRQGVNLWAGTRGRGCSRFRFEQMMNMDDEIAHMRVIDRLLRFRLPCPMRYGEGVYTKCNFYQSDDTFNCAYNHSIYQTGYRYLGRAIGHGTDNDTLMFSTGLLLIDREDNQWRGLIRYGELNRGGAPDSHNSLTPTKQTLMSIDLMYSRVFRFGVIELGGGFDSIDDDVSGVSVTSGRAFLQWRSSY
jgi:hypothetical protein